MVQGQRKRQRQGRQRGQQIPQRGRQRGRQRPRRQRGLRRQRGRPPGPRSNRHVYPVEPTIVAAMDATWSQPTSRQKIWRAQCRGIPRLLARHLRMRMQRYVYRLQGKPGKAWNVDWIWRFGNQATWRFEGLAKAWRFEGQATCRMISVHSSCADAPLVCVTWPTSLQWESGIFWS